RTACARCATRSWPSSPATSPPSPRPPAPWPSPDVARRSRTRAATPQEVADLSRQLAAFLRAGIPLIDAIDVIAKETGSPRLQPMLVDVGSTLREGEAF